MPLSTDGDSVSQIGQNISFKLNDILDVHVDAKDSVNNWCVGKIIDYNPESFKLTVHFDGWSQRYDEVSNPYLNQTYLLQTLRLNSSNLVPFRKYSQGYTGQRNIAFRDFALNYAY